MKFTLSWLKEHLDTLPKERYAHSLAIAVELGNDLKRLDAFASAAASKTNNTQLSNTRPAIGVKK